MVQLRHEDLRRIADLMKDYVPPHLARQSINTIKREQASLIPLLTASKAFYHYCAPALYSDCVVDDMSAFINGTGVVVGRSLDQLQRLRIIHGTGDDEPTYPYLLIGNNWKYLVNRWYPGEMDMEVVMVEADKLAAIGASITNCCPCDRHPMFPRLEKVVMGGIRESIWTQYPLGYGYKTRGYTHDLPLALISLPSVRHYCQSLQVGPLSLPSFLLEVRAPLETFTYHAVPGHGPSPHPQGMPPIVLGAINRYHFSYCHVVVSMDGQTPLITPEEVKRITVMIIAMIKRDCLNSLTVANSAYDDTDLPPPKVEGTILEFYDLVRHVQIHPPEVGLEYPFFAGRARWLADRPSKCLDVFQDLIQKEFGSWSHRIVLKNREDAPLCSACGLDQVEEWNHQPEPEGDNPSEAYLCSERVLSLM